MLHRVWVLFHGGYLDATLNVYNSFSILICCYDVFSFISLFLGNRRLPLLPTMLSIVVSFMSAIAILGLVAETYVYGIQAVVMHIPSFVIGIVLAERLFVPWIYRMHLTSVYEVCALAKTSIFWYQLS